MAARAIWKGTLRFGSVKVPVKLYSAIEDRSIRFNLLHDQDYVPVKQRMVNPNTEKTVPHDKVRKAYEVDRGVFVFLDDDELKSLEPEPSRDIEVLQFVEAADVSPHWYVRPYFLGPDEDGDAEYFALVHALAKQGKEGIARWVMRGHTYIGALRSENGYLSLITLRHSEEVILTDELAPPEGRPLDKKERDLAEQLVEALEEDFDPKDYRDEYRELVMKLIAAKRSGKPLKAPKRPRKPKTTSLAQSLQASLKRVKHRPA
jgi:DNA end-binding protein Ku